MASENETSQGRRRLRIAAGVVLAAATVLVALTLAGVFSGDDGDDGVAGERPAAPPAAPPQPREGGGDAEPKLTTVRVGGRPTAVASSGGAVWVADSFQARATMLESEARSPETVGIDLEGPAAGVAASPESAWYALPEQQLVERRDRADPASGGERIELDGFPTVVAAGEGAVWALSERAVQRIDPESGEVGDPIGSGGFASSVAAGEGGVWVVVDNRELVLIEPGSGQREGEPVELPEPFGVSVGEGAVWVVSASGEVIRVDPDSLEPTSAPRPVRGALDVAAGHGAVWVTASDRTVTRLDPETLERIGEPLRVGDEPASVAAGERAVWVANGGDGSLTRIQP